MLASLTGPLPPDTERAADQTEIDLGEDVVTLSYERALHAHARYKPANLSVWEADSDAVAMAEPVGGARKAGGVGEMAGILLRADKQFKEQPCNAEHTAASRTVRTASVTIRLSNQECTQLRQRAAEAGLTMSAYLRSCVLEADALRAQVKEALAELRLSEKSKVSNPAATVPAPRPWFTWMTRARTRKRKP